MPGVLNSDEPVCAVCASHTTKKCARCRAVRYCSIKCQMLDWGSGHKEKCKKYSGVIVLNSAQNGATNGGFKASAAGSKSSNLITSVPCGCGGTSKPIKQRKDKTKTSRQSLRRRIVISETESLPESESVDKVVISPIPEEYPSSEFREQGFPFHAPTLEYLVPSPNPSLPPPEDIPEEELSRYFGGDDSPSPIASTVEEDLKQIEATLQGGIPTNVEEVRAFRTTLYRVGSSNLVTSSQQELFKQLALQIGDLSRSYLGFKDQHDRASRDLDQMQTLLASKTALKKTYADVEVERKVILERQKEVDERTSFLKVQQEKIREELEQLAPETMRLTESLRSTNNWRSSLYNSTRVDAKLSQKACLEMDFATSKDGLEAQHSSWECFKISIAHAKALVPPFSMDMEDFHVVEP